MTLAVLDTNVFVQAVIGSKGASSKRVMNAFVRNEFQIAVSESTINELFEVLLLPQIRRRHGWHDDQVLEFVAGIERHAMVVSRLNDAGISANLPRDVSDVKFLALADAVGADYLVTNDRRHLLSLQSFRGIPIVTPAEFLKRLAVGE